MVESFCGASNQQHGPGNRPDSLQSQVETQLHHMMGRLIADHVPTGHPHDERGWANRRAYYRVDGVDAGAKGITNPAQGQIAAHEMMDGVAFEKRKTEILQLLEELRQPELSSASASS